MTPQARQIIEEIASLRGVDPARLLGRCRSQPVFRARVEVAMLLDARGYSTPQIGRMLNHDHTTIVYYLGRGKKRPGKRRWRTPVVRHVRWLRPKKKPRPERYLLPYAGFDMTEYSWKERRA